MSAKYRNGVEVKKRTVATEGIFVMKKVDNMAARDHDGESIITRQRTKQRRRRTRQD